MSKGQGTNPFGTPMTSRKVRRMFEKGKGNASIAGSNTQHFGFRSVGTYVGDYTTLMPPKEKAPTREG